MKKHELIKWAYDKYPKGTVATYGGEPIICEGKYEFTSYGWILNIESGRPIYDSDKDQWATIIPEQPESILSGKCAIQVNNEREFKLLMEHYEAKGWKGCILYTYDFTYDCYDYHENYRRSTADIQKSDGYTIIPFSDFAAEVGITVPKFILKSEDGVDLYEGDDYHRVYYFDNDDESVHKGWKYDTCKFLSEPHAVVTGLQQAKAFSTKEAAEAWILEQNKPKEIIVSPESSYPIEVRKDGALILCGATANHFSNLELTGKEIDEIYTAYLKLSREAISC